MESRSALRCLKQFSTVVVFHMTQLTPILHVLVMDDDPGDRALVIQELQREFPHLHAQEILGAESLAQALEAGTVDAIVMDAQLSWMTGLEILQRVKQQYPYCSMIMFTNTGNEEIAVEAMKAGLDDYVLKSFRQSTRLPLALRTALERAGTRRRAALLEIRLQSVLNQLSVGIFRFNPDGRILECNPAFLHLLGVSSLEQAQTLQLLNLQGLYDRLINTPATQKPRWEIEFNQPNGRLVWVLLSLTPSTVEGMPVVDALMEDITALKQAQTELQQLNETLEERVRERTAKLAEAVQDLEAFAYSASHDLREPLRSIQGLSQILLEEEMSLEQRQVYLQQIYVSTQFAEQLIQDLLIYSRLSYVDVTLQPINLSRLVNESLDQLQAERQWQHAHIQIDEPLTDVMANYTVLRQVITNLITNAIKFVEPGVQPQIRIWTETVPPDSSKTRLWIEDNGIGIAPEVQDQIFDVFARLHGHEVYPGTGIGLAIARRGIQRMGGTVGVESYAGQGSRFWIELSTAAEI
jgi:PAS domain S-box-containing protein